MKIHTIIILGSMIATSAWAQDSNMRRDGSRMEVSVEIPLQHYMPQGNQAILVTPMIAGAADTIALKPIGIYGRRRWRYYERQGHMIAANETSLQSWNASESYQYTDWTPYQPWMDECSLILTARSYGCCGSSAPGDAMLLASYAVPVVIEEPVEVVEEVAVVEEVEPATIRVSGSAWVQFPVNETVIYPERYNNPSELAKITASIDSVRSLPGVNIHYITLKGYASPESSYENNTRLAQGRTQAVLEYVQSLYNFPEGLIRTEYEPEDWEGLRRLVDESRGVLKHRAAILDIIDEDMTDLDRKEWLIKSKYPDDYRYMLQNWYPQLRHTDYSIDYYYTE